MAFLVNTISPGLAPTNAAMRARADAVLADHGRAAEVRLRPSRGTHLVLREGSLPGLEMAVLAPVPGETNRFVMVLPQHDGRVYVGEITFTCTSGLSDFRPPRYDLEFGQRLRLPEKKPFKGVML